MIRPPRGVWSFMSRNASWVQRNAPVRLTSTTRRHCSTVRSSSGTGGAPVPALLNSRSSRPNVSFVAVEERLHRRPGRSRRSARRAPAGRPTRASGRLLQRICAPAGEHDRVALPQEGEGGRPADARARARDDCHFPVDLPPQSGLLTLTEVNSWCQPASLCGHACAVMTVMHGNVTDNTGHAARTRGYRHPIDRLPITPEA